MTDSKLSICTRRQVIATVAASACTGLMPTTGTAQESTIRLSVGFPPGGSGDLFARFLADALRDELGRPVVVENRPGGGGMTVAQQFLRAPKDGNHLMLATGSTAISAPISRAKPPYNPVDDFQWIALMSNAPFVIALHPSVPVRDLQGFVAYCKENPGKLSYGHAGLGTTVHLAGELLKERAGINVLMCPMQAVRLRSMTPSPAQCKQSWKHRPPCCRTINQAGCASSRRWQRPVKNCTRDSDFPRSRLRPDRRYMQPFGSTPWNTTTSARGHRPCCFARDGKAGRG